MSYMVSIANQSSRPSGQVFARVRARSLGLGWRLGIWDLVVSALRRYSLFTTHYSLLHWFDASTTIPRSGSREMAERPEFALPLTEDDG